MARKQTGGKSNKGKSSKNGKLLKSVITLVLVVVLGLVGNEKFSFDELIGNLIDSFNNQVETNINENEQFEERQEENPETQNQQNSTVKPSEEENDSEQSKGEYTSDNLVVTFFDVGQADSILLRTGDKVMLVDTGNAGDANESGKLVKGNINLIYELYKMGVDHIDILVATHPHEDHMGSMYKIINSFEIGDLYINAVHEEYIEKGFYERFYNAMVEKNVHQVSPTTLSEEEIIIKVNEYNNALKNDDDEENDEDVIVYDKADYIRPGDVIKFGNATITVLAPNSAEYSDTNDYSIVFMVEFEGKKIMLTGDAGKEAEEEILKFAEKNNIDLNCDILKVGHHGSRTANTEEFIEAVDAEYAVIMVEAGHKYGLPDEDVVERLERYGATIYDTTNHGDITLIIDDGNYEFDFAYQHEEKE